MAGCLAGKWVVGIGTWQHLRLRFWLQCFVIRVQVVAVAFISDVTTRSKLGIRALESTLQPKKCRHISLHSITRTNPNFPLPCYTWYHSKLMPRYIVSSASDANLLHKIAQPSHKNIYNKAYPTYQLLSPKRV